MSEKNQQPANSRPSTAGRRRAKAAWPSDAELETSATNRRKFELDASAAIESADRSNELSVIVKVSEGGYVPKAVSLRARIDPRMFTATVRHADLDTLNEDPLVLSVSTPKPLHLERS